MHSYDGHGARGTATLRWRVDAVMTSRLANMLAPLSATMKVPAPNTLSHGSCACTKLASLTRPKNTSEISTICPVGSAHAMMISAAPCDLLLYLPTSTTHDDGGGGGRHQRHG